MLDIHHHNGQLALKDAGLYDRFLGLVHEGGEALRVLDRHGTVVFERPDDGHGRRPEVLRGALRQLLLDALPAGTVRWGHKVTAARSLGDGRHEVTFADGTAVTAGLLVGADGAWSRVRPLLSGARPAYAGAVFVETYLFDSDERHPASAEAVGGGSLFALAPGKGITAHREPGGVLHTYVQLAREREWIDGIDLTDTDTGAATARLAAEFEGWAPELTALLTDGETAPAVRILHTLPNEHRWERVPGVTLLGDAAHLMPPSSEGANLAMFDGAELGKALAAHPDDTEAALTAYEAALFPRSAAHAAEAAELLPLLLDDKAPYSLVEMFTGARRGADQPEADRPETGSPRG
jgi:2-polyprenyl-6-methoxyphenol hydroxylase-like FAD-dependent oxidoreductase